MPDRSSGPAGDAVAAALAEDVLARAARRLEPPDRALLPARLERELPVLLARLGELYRDRTDVAVLAGDLLGDALELLERRPADLRALDRRREADPQWFQDPRMVGYVCYVDRFAGTLQGVRGRLDYLAELGVSYLHLMPVLRPRAGDSDGGYAVADYDTIDPRLGTMADLSALAADVHHRDMALCVDLVLNHTAREHPWAQRAMAGDAEYRNYFLIFPDRTVPDAFERTLPDIFPVLAPGNFTFVEELDGWVWTTFRNFQWDLDYANPRVFRAMAATMLALANRGPDVLRLDAAPFLWKKLGTDCQNLPETHLLLQAFRAVIGIAAPGVLLKAEAMVAPDLLPAYLGAHGEYRPECHLAYDNQLMVMLWSMLATGSSALARHALTRRPPAPAAASWATFLRSHDDIGWAVTDADAAAVAMSGPAHREFLSDFYSGAVPGSFARGAVFQKAPAGGSPISGTAASLCGVSAALAAHDEHALDVAAHRLIALYSVVFSFGGIPLVFMGDELAQPNDPEWWQDPAHAQDNRWLHRPELDWEAAERRCEPGTVEHRVFSAIRALADARRGTAALRADGRVTIPDLGVPGLFGYLRTAPGAQPLLGLVDIAGAGQRISADRIAAAGLSGGVVLRAGDPSAALTEDGVVLPPYGFAWLTR